MLFESGVSAMRSFAALGQGTLDIDSAPGRGTRVTARLGASPAPATATRGEGDPRSRLRLLVSDDRSVDEA